MTQESIDSNFTSMHPTVEFLDILDLYSFNEDLSCKYKFNDYTPKEGDRVAIFKIGWSLVKDYIVFEWAPVNISGQGSITLNKHILPKNSSEVYQICYISSESELHGASTPFQFYSEEMLVASSCPSTSKSLSENISKSHIFLEHKDQEIARLKEENILLKESLKALLLSRNNGSVKNYDEDIQELKELTQALKSMLQEHEKELDMLKSKITEGGEEYKKLYLEKIKIERKYDRLKNRRSERDSFQEEVKPINNDNFDIGDLTSIPPFPSLLK